MLFPSGHVAALRDCCSSSGRSPIRSKQVALAHHHFHFKKIQILLLLLFKKGDGLRGFNFVTK